MTPAALRNYTRKDLAQMAKLRGVEGWHAMRKDQLVSALVQKAKEKAPARRATAPAASRTHATVAKVAQKASDRRVQMKISQYQAKLEKAKNLGAASDAEVGKERLVVKVRDPYWLHAHWQLSRNSVQRVQAALGQYWHTARPMLRLFEVSNVGSATASEMLVRQIEIHGGVNNWYLDVKDPPKSYRLDIGYQTSDGHFHAMARSNVVTTPPAAVRDAIDENWTDVAENFDKIYAMSGGYAPEGTSDELRELMEERLRRPMGAPLVTRYGAGAGSLLELASDFHFEADAEMIVFGSTKPGSHVTLEGEPVQLRPDGTFTVRLNLPDRRQVLPLVASSADGMQQRTIVLAIERNTKRMETVTRDANV
jgi:hypothetical protein